MKIHVATPCTLNFIMWKKELYVSGMTRSCDVLPTGKMLPPLGRPNTCMAKRVQGISADIQGDCLMHFKLISCQVALPKC